MRDRVLGHHLRHGLLDRQAGADHLLVVVEQLDRDVLVGVRPAQQRVALLELVVGQREGGVPVELDVVAVEHERLAGGALALLAAVHEHDSLLGRGPQDRLVLVDLDLDADRLEPHDMLVGHDPLAELRLAGRGQLVEERGRRAGPAALLPVLLAWSLRRPQARVGRRALPVVVGLEGFRSSGVISLSSTFGLCTGPIRRRWSSVHIFFGSRSRCGCAVMVLPSSRT